MKPLCSWGKVGEGAINRLVQKAKVKGEGTVRPRPEVESQVGGLKTLVTGVEGAVQGAG